MFIQSTLNEAKIKFLKSNRQKKFLKSSLCAYNLKHNQNDLFRLLNHYKQNEIISTCIHRVTRGLYKHDKDFIKYD